MHEQSHVTEWFICLKCCCNKLLWIYYLLISIIHSDVQVFFGKVPYSDSPFFIIYRSHFEWSPAKSGTGDEFNCWATFFLNLPILQNKWFLKHSFGSTGKLSFYRSQHILESEKTRKLWFQPFPNPSRRFDCVTRRLRMVGSLQILFIFVFKKLASL